MSRHTALTATAALPTEINAALTLVTSTDQVYTGRRARSPARTDGEVWIERLPEEPRGRGMETLSAVPFMVHIYSAVGNAGPDKTGDAQLLEVEGAAQELVTYFHASRRLSATVSLVTWSAVEESIDVDPQDARRAEATVRLTAFVRNT